MNKSLVFEAKHEGKRKEEISIINTTIFLFKFEDTFVKRVCRRSACKTSSKPFAELCFICHIPVAAVDGFKTIDTVLKLTLMVQGTLDPCTAPTIFSHQQQHAYQQSHVAALLINLVVLDKYCKVFPPV